jgi:hypothetical protein
MGRCGDAAVGNAGIRSAHDRGQKLGIEQAGRPTDAARDELLRKIEAYAMLGFDELGLSFPWRTPEEFVERLEWSARALSLQG